MILLLRCNLFAFVIFPLLYFLPLIQPMKSTLKVICFCLLRSLRYRKFLFPFINFIYTVLIFLLALSKNERQISLPISNPFLIYLIDSPAEIFRYAILMISEINIVEVVVPSPANLFVPSTLFFTSVAIAS